LGKPRKLDKRTSLQENHRRRPDVNRVAQSPASYAKKVLDSVFWENPHTRKIFEEGGYKYEDLKQEALFALLKADKDFEGKKSANFRGLVYKAVKNHLNNLLIKAEAQKRVEGILSEFYGRKNPDIIHAERERIFFSREVAEQVVGIALTFNKKSRKYFFEYFGLGGTPPKTFKEVAELHGVRHQAVSKSVRVSLETIRNRLKGKGVIP